MILYPRLNLQRLGCYFCSWNFVLGLLFFLLSRGWFLWFPNHFLVWHHDNEQVSVPEVFALFSRKLQIEDNFQWSINFIRRSHLKPIYRKRGERTCYLPYFGLKTSEEFNSDISEFVFSSFHAHNHLNLSALPVLYNQNIIGWNKTFAAYEE